MLGTWCACPPPAMHKGKPYLLRDGVWSGAFGSWWGEGEVVRLGLLMRLVSPRRRRGWGWGPSTTWRHSDKAAVQPRERPFGEPVPPAPLSQTPSLQNWEAVTSCHVTQSTAFCCAAWADQSSECPHLSVGRQPGPLHGAVVGPGGGKLSKVRSGPC